MCRDLFQTELRSLDTASVSEDIIESHRVSMKVLKGPKEALSAKILAIRQAQKSIDITVYQLFKDETGYLYLHELQKAAARGVRVRLLVDALGSFSFSHHELEHLLNTFTGVRPEVKLANLTFHPKPAFARFMSLLRGETSFRNWFSSLNSRVHDKIVLIDSGTPEAFAIFGSANMTNDSTGLGSSEKDTTKEIEAIVRPIRGAGTIDADQEIENYFESLYEFIGNHQLWDRSPNIFDFSGARMQQNYVSASANADKVMDLEKNIQQMAQENFLNTQLTPSDFELVHELPNLIRKTNVFTMKWFRWGKRLNEKTVVRSLSKRMLRAQKRIEIVSPYFLIGDTDIRKIERLLLKKPDLEFHLYINSFTTIDHRTASAIFEEFVGPKLAALKTNPLIGERLKIKVFVGDSKADLLPNYFHMKAVRVDDEFWIGSHNFDFRSIRLNSEVGAWMNSPQGHLEIGKAIAEIDRYSVEWGSPAWLNIIQQNPVFFDFQKFILSVSKVFKIQLLL